jgi:hypothetical protein
LAVTTDNASNNDTFIRYLLDVDVIADKECHIRCFAHVLNLAAEAALAEIKPEIENLRTLIKAVKHRRIVGEAMSNGCAELNLPYKKPFLNVATRWNSTYEMLAYAIQYQVPLMRSLFELVLQKLDREIDDYEQIHVDDWPEFLEYCEFLKDFYNATQHCTAEKETTLSSIVPWYNLLLNHAEGTSLYSIFD